MFEARKVARSAKNINGVQYEMCIQSCNEESLFSSFRQKQTNQLRCFSSDFKFLPHDYIVHL